MTPASSAQVPVTGELKIACVGEAMVELTLGQNSTNAPALAFAGDALNTAIYLKRLLGDNAEIGFVTVLGTDPLSDRMLEFIESESVSTNHIERLAHKLPGLYAISTDTDGERSFSYWRTESAARELFQTCNSPASATPSEKSSTGGNYNFAVLEHYNVLYLTAITIAILPASARRALMAWLRDYKKVPGTTVVFDSNYRPALWESEPQAQEAISDLWKICDIALPSLDDELALFKDSDEMKVIERLHSYDIQRGAMKRGSAGPVTLCQSSRSEQSAPETAYRRVPVVDSTAAGDCFNAGYLSIALTGGSEDDALQKGHECAVKAIQHPGAIVPATAW